MKNIFHRYIRLPFEIEKPPICNLKLKQLKHQDIPYHKDGKMINFLAKLGLNILNTEVFYTPGSKSLPIHIDNTELDNHVKINISYGPPEGATRWWKPLNFDHKKEYNEQFDDKLDEEGKKDLIGLKDTYLQHRSIRLEEEECELLYEANTDKPSLVNVGAFHSSYNPTDEGRWTLCFVIGKNNKYLYWDDAMEIFKDYIE